MDSSNRSKYHEMKYEHNNSKHMRKSHRHHDHKHRKRKDYSHSHSPSRSRSRAHSKTHSHSRYQKPHHSPSRSKMNHNRNYSNRNYKSDKKDYYKTSQYSSSSHRINNNMYNKSSYKEERGKYGMNISNNISRDKDRERERDKERDNERYKVREYEYNKEREYKENRMENNNIISRNMSNYSNMNSNRTKIIINLFDEKKEKEKEKEKENIMSTNINSNIFSDKKINNISNLNTISIKNEITMKDEYYNKSAKEKNDEKEKEDIDPKNRIYYFITKNDKMKILFKVFPNNNSSSISPINPNSDNVNPLSENIFFSFTQTRQYKSIRNDLWSFKINHKYISHLLGGKINLELKIKKLNKSNEPKPYYSSIIQILDSLTFNIEFNINFNSFRSHNNSISNLSYEAYYTTQDIIIPPEYYTNITNFSEIPFVVELLVSKSFNNISKLEKGQYNGIKNEGATCYMNSMLQTLYSIYPFKKAVFQIPTDKDDNSSIVLSLQRLFYDLMTNHSPVSSRNLINSFGWTREQIQIQHDVQEFNQLLIEEMENKMKGTQVEGSFNKMLTGKINNYIQCVYFDYKSEIEESFIEIQLTIKGYKNIYESFDAYTAEEILDNENKYETEKYGKQKAKKGIKFLSIPPVLFLQLKRFEYNSKKDIMVKVNDYFEYYNEIDLAKYVDPIIKKEEKKENFIYELHSVIVHQGNANSGHYYAYIKQSNDNRDWLLFNDEHVRPADNYEIFRQNFGGQSEIYKNKGAQGEIVSNNINYERSAYILVYIQKNRNNKFVSENNLDIIPNYLKKRFENEKEDEKNAANKKKRDLENINIFLFSNLNCIYHKNKLGIINSFIDLNMDAPFTYNMNSRLLINFPQNIKINDFLTFINQKTLIPRSEMMLFDFEGNDDFSILKRQNYDIKLISNLDMTLAEYKIKNKKAFLIFFLYAREPYIIFSNLGTVKDLCEDYKVGNSADEKKSVIFISRTYNKFSFKLNNNEKNNNMNNNNYRNISTNSKTDLSLINEKINIIFLKKYDILGKEYTLHKIIDVNIDDSDLYNKILSQYNIINKINPKIILYFILENSYSISDEYIIINESNIKKYLSIIKSMILIPVYREEEKTEIINYINELNRIIYIDINCTKCFGDEENTVLINQKMKKIKIQYNKELDDEKLISIIYQNLVEKNILNKLCEKIKIFYMDNNKRINIVNEEYLKNKNFVINLIKENYDKEEMLKMIGSEYNEYQILKYFDLINCRINLEINLYENNSLQEFYYQEFNIFDINNNYVSKLCTLIPKKMRKTKEILEYIKSFLDEYFKKENYELNHYFFLLQKKNHNYLYQIITNENIELKLYESKFKDIEYRIQPFYNDDINKIYNSEHKKIFVTFTENNYFYPMMIYLKSEDNFKKIKYEMSKKIEKMKGFQEMPNNNYYIKNRTEFYIYKGILSQDKMFPDKLIKDDDTVGSVFKDTSGACNLLISFIKIH